MSKVSLGSDFKKIVTHLPGLLEADKFIAENGTTEQLHFKSNLLSYLKYYDLPSYKDKTIELTIGKLKAFDFDVVAQIYQSNQFTSYKGCIVFVHGYLDHFGLYRNLINLLVSHGYIVAGIDLPGHGLSTGKIAHIADFGQYAHSLEVLVEVLKQKYTQKDFNFTLFGYSAGAAIGTEYLLRNHQNSVFTKALWLAPLLRIPRWKFSELASYFLPFLKYVPRETKNSSHDARFITFVRFNDPMQPKLVPLQWLNAMHHWAARLPKYQPLEIDTCIIQGTEDKTIDWKYNIPNFSKIYLNHQVHYVFDAYHNLCNESQQYRDLTFNYIMKFLNDKCAIIRNESVTYCSLA